MRTLGRVSVLVLVIFVAGASAQEWGIEKSTTLKVGDEQIEVAMPLGWTWNQLPAPPGLPPTVELTKGQSANLRITFIPAPDGKLTTQADIEGVTKAASRQYVDGSVEKQIRIQDLKAKSGPGALAEFTDASLVGKPVPPGESKVIATGVVRVGKAAAAFTLSGSAFDDADYTKAKEMLVNGLRVAK